MFLLFKQFVIQSIYCLPIYLFFKFVHYKLHLYWRLLMNDPILTLLAYDLSYYVISLFISYWFYVKSGIFILTYIIIHSLQQLFYIIIIMLKKIISRTVVIVKDQSNLMRLNCKPIYNFSGLQISSKLNKAISAEIAHQQANIEDISSYQNYFKNSGWNINYNDVQIQLSTQNKGYDIRALFNCKTPVSQPEMQQNQQQADQMMSGFDFSQISLYVRKQGQNKWFNCEFIVPTNGQAHINVMRFTQDYEWEKSQRAKRRQIPSAYNGPDVTSLEEKFQDAVYQFISGIGVSVDILQKVAEFSLSYEHKFYIQWLKDFKALS